MIGRVGRQVRAVLALVLTLMALSSAVLVPAAGASATFGTPPQTSATTAQNTSVVLLPIVVNATNSSVAVDLNVTNGTITLASTAGLTFCDGGNRPNNSSNVRFSGTQNAVNNALSGITFNPAAGFSGQTFLSTKVNDDATDACTNFDISVDNSASTTITVSAAPSPTPTPTPTPTPSPTPSPSPSPVTSATTISVPPTQTIDQDTTLTFSTGNNNRITVSNPATAASIDLSIVANLAGTQLTLPNTAGLTFVSGNGTSTLLMTGTQAAINNALNGLILTPPAGYAGPIGLSLSTTDNPEGGVGLQVNVRARTATQVGSSPSTPVAVGTQVILNSITTRQNTSGLTTVPTGTVTFLIDGNVVCTNAPLTPNGGVGTSANSGCVAPALTVGTHIVTANYSGDASFVPSSNTYQLVITKANTTITDLGVSPSPLYCDASSVNVSAHLNSTTAATFANGTGTVTVTVKNSNSAVIGSATGTPNPVQGAGTTVTVSATVPLSGPVAFGPYTFDVTYSGDGTFNGSNLSQSILIAPVNASIALDLSSLTATYGDANVELRANVTGNGNAATVNGGTVTFVVKKGNTTLGTVTGTVVNGVARANFPLTGVNAGNYSVTATYGGTSCYTVNDETRSVTGTLKVKQRLIWIKPVDQTRAVGTPNPSPCALELTLGTTLAPGDRIGPGQAINTSQQICTYSTPTTKPATPGTYVITAGNLVGPNYDIRFKPGTLTLTR